jgi:hypothetical protein
MPLALHTKLVLAAVTIGLSADACAEQVVRPSGGATMTPSEVLAAPDSFLDARIRVRGRVHLVRHDTLGPCDPTAVGGCSSATSAALQLTTEGEPPGVTTALDLYRTGERGVAEPLGCKAVGTNQFDCGSFKQGASAVVEGRVLKHRIPTQQIGTPAGEVQVIRYREIYVLLVQP